MTREQFAKSLAEDLQRLGVLCERGDVLAFVDDLIARRPDTPTAGRLIRQFLVSRLEPGSRVAIRTDAALYAHGARGGIVEATCFTARQFFEGQTPFPPPVLGVEGFEPAEDLDMVFAIVRIDPCTSFPVGACMTVGPYALTVMSRPGDPPAN